MVAETNRLETTTSDSRLGRWESVEQRGELRVLTIRQETLPCQIEQSAVKSRAIWSTDL